ncbi:MAG: bacillithiol biosynthesis cysteine-adding enzyme BshC [Pyrinomonadaceae bacterium]
MNCEAAADSLASETCLIDYAELPSQTRLLLDFLARDSKLPAELWPNGATSLTDFAKDVLANYTTDRDRLAEILIEENRIYESPEAVFRNIERLRRPGSVAVISGQQADLYGGPAYSVYKALSAVKLVAKLTEKGIDAVPVFWIATEDHDFQEISSVNFRSESGEILNATIPIADSDRGRPVGNIKLPPCVERVADDIVSALPETGFTKELRELLSESYSSGATVGDAFGKLFARLLGKYGLILMNPLNKGIRELSAPLFKKAIEHSDSIRSQLHERDELLASHGYHSQVNIGQDFFPLFHIGEDGNRIALRKDESGIRTRDGAIHYSSEDLLEIAENRPFELSPNVILRPLVQDFVFPTVCYIGGPAEVAYFAQSSTVYEALERPATPIRLRSSFTILEPRHRRTMDRYELGFSDVLRGREAILAELAMKWSPKEVHDALDAMETRIREGFEQIRGTVTSIDPTLEEHLEKRRLKLEWHLEAFRKKFLKAGLRSDGDRIRRVDDVFDSVYPEGVLQERSLCFLDFVNRYGFGVVDEIHARITGHDLQHIAVVL